MFYDEISHFFVTWVVERNSLTNNTAISKSPKILNCHKTRTHDLNLLALSTNPHSHRAHHVPLTSVSRERHLLPRSVLLGVSGSAA